MVFSNLNTYSCAERASFPWEICFEALCDMAQQISAQEYWWTSMLLWTKCTHWLVLLPKIRGSTALLQILSRVWREWWEDRTNARSCKRFGSEQMLDSFQNAMVQQLLWAWSWHLFFQLVKLDSIWRNKWIILASKHACLYPLAPFYFTDGYGSWSSRRRSTIFVLVLVLVLTRHDSLQVSGLPQLDLHGVIIRKILENTRRNRIVIPVRSKGLDKLVSLGKCDRPERWCELVDVVRVIHSFTYDFRRHLFAISQRNHRCTIIQPNWF